MRLVQYRDGVGGRGVASVLADGTARVLVETATVYDLARAAIGAGTALMDLAAARATGEVVDLEAVDRDGRWLSPLDHPDPAHCFVTGTGLTHLGSADARDKMHTKLESDELSDSMKMFKMGLEDGKPGRGETGVQPEWFYKGDGSCVVAPGAALARPSFALDGGEEPEIAGLYVIADDGTPCRVGFALGNEFSDHVMERQNYLYLAHSKLRTCAVGPEVLLGELPDNVSGRSRIRRGETVLWEKPFVSGEANMSHTIANLEHHHFKYAMFRRPGDVHVHFFGTATLSFADGVNVEEGDVFEVEAAAFGRPLRNPLTRIGAGEAAVRTL